MIRSLRGWLCFTYGIGTPSDIDASHFRLYYFPLDDLMKKDDEKEGDKNA